MENSSVRNITWVNFVRDRTVASVFALVTSQRTGSGGQQFILNLDGQGPFARVRDSLEYTSRQGDTDDENRRALTRILSLGLARYARTTDIGSRLQVTLRAGGSNAAAAGARGAKDRWNLWVYSISANTFAAMRTTRAQTSLARSTHDASPKPGSSIWDSTPITPRIGSS